MYSYLYTVLLSLASLPYGQGETVLGAYIYQRHGDRTSKSTPPTVLTDLGYSEVFMTGSYFHNRYVSSNSTLQITGISDNTVTLSQISASSPEDLVIQNSAVGFLQGLYPPVGTAQETLRNGSTVSAPMDGYQLIPVDSISSGTNSESSPWLQSTSNCNKALISSNNYFTSPEYESLFNSTGDFYKSLAPVLNRTFTSSQMSYKNAFTIWDYINVAMIHNSSDNFPAESLITDDVFHQLLVLANTHEWNLAYNSSDTIRAIAGSVLAGQVVAALNDTITSGGSSKLNIQFGAYATFLSYFGLAQLPAVNAEFYGMPTYASSMIWELVTNSTSSSFPAASEIGVRFYFHNGTLDGSSDPAVYPLFGQSNTVLPWSDFVSNMNTFAISTQAQWCQACGNSTGVCAGTSDSSSGSSTGASANAPSSGGGMSLAVAGVIGAMVTLGVILGTEAFVLLAFGLRLTKRGAKAVTPSVTDEGEK